MNQFIGRQREKQIFERLLKSGQSEFVAVYGRRRVGITQLVQNDLEMGILFEAV